MRNKTEALIGEQKSFLNAVKWAYTLFWGEKGISAVLYFLLAGLLGPKDFGTVAIAAIYIGFLQMFLDQGFAAALIQRKFLEQAHLDLVFWMNFALSLVLLVISILFSRNWAEFTHAPEVESVIFVLSFGIVLEALSIVQTAILRRQMDFRVLSIRTNTAMVVSGVIGVGMALLGFGVWSLVSQQLIRDLLAIVLLWRMSSWRPRLSFSWPSFYELLGFSVPNFVAQLANFADAQVASTVLGALFGPVAVGLYKFVERAVATVISMSSGSIHTVSFPQFARFQDNSSEIRKSVLTALRMTAIMSLPPLSGLAVTSDPLMATIGPEWVPASDALKVLSVLGMAMVFANFTSPLLQAFGRPQQGAALEWGRTIAGSAVLVVAGLMVQNGSAQYQVVSIAVARLCTGLFLIAPVFVYILLKRSHVSLHDFLITLFPSALASAAVVLSVELFRYSGMFQELRSVIALMQEMAIGAIVGLTTLIFADLKVRRTVWLISLKVVKSWSTKASVRREP